MTQIQYRNDLDRTKPQTWRFCAPKPLFYKFFLFLFFSLTTLSPPLKAKPHQPTVAVIQIVEHPALDATRQGVFDALKAQGFEPNKDIKWIYGNAQGNVSLALQLAQKSVAIQADVIVTIATVPTQAAMAVTRDVDTPLVFASVSDPVTSKIVENLEKPEGRVTGVSNLTPIRPQLEMFRELVPHLKRLGVVFNPGEANSVRLNELMIEEGKKMGIEIVLSPATKSSDVGLAATKLAGSVDALFVNNDNTALAAFESIVQAGLQYNIPAFVSDVDMLDRGALAALGPNQYEVGIQAGNQVAKLLRGKKVQNIPVEFPQKIELHLNEKVAQRLNLTIPERIKNRAKRVVKFGKRD